MGFKRDGSAREWRIPGKPKGIDTALWEYLEKQRQEHNHLARTLNTNLTTLERTASGSVTIVVPSEATPSGGATAFSEYQKKIQAVVAGTNTITFDEALSASSYALYLNIRNANGEKVLYREVERTAAHVIIADVYEAGTAECLAVL